MKNKIFTMSLSSLNNAFVLQIGDLRVKIEYAGISGKTQLGPPSEVCITQDRYTVKSPKFLKSFRLEVFTCISNYH